MAEDTKTKRAPAKCKKVVDVVAGTVSFQFGPFDKAGVGSGPLKVFTVGEFPPAIQTRFPLHGLSQKIGDVYSGDKTIESAIDSLDAVVAQLMADKWGATRGEGTGPSAGKRVRALFRLAESNTKWSNKFMGISAPTMENVGAWYADQTEDFQKLIYTSDEVKRELVKMANEEIDSAAGSNSIMG